MRTPHRLTPFLLTLAALGAAPVSAASASGADVITDCRDGTISGKHSQKDYADALRNIPTDLDEYTDCRDVIGRARLGSAGGGAGGGGAGGSAGAAGGTATPGAADGSVAGGVGGAATAGASADEVLKTASPAERKQVAAAQEAGAPVQVGRRLISPAASGLSPAGAANVVPTPLIVALALLGAGLAAGAAQVVRTRVRSRRAPGS